MRKLHYFTALFLMITLNVFAQKHQDKVTAYEINEAGKYSFTEMKGYGNVLEVVSQKYFPSQTFEESNCIWIKVSPQLVGSLILKFNPIDSRDQFSYVLLKTDTLKKLRPTTKLAKVNSLSRLTTNDENNNIRYLPIVERTNTNSLAELHQLTINVEQGDEYYIIVNNKNSSRGFNLELSTTTFIDYSDQTLASVK